MAESLEVDRELLNKYGDVPDPILTTLEGKSYSDAEFKRTPVYSIPSKYKLSLSQLQQVGEQFSKYLSDGGDHALTVPLMILLAINLRDIEDSDNMILKSLNWGQANTVALDLEKMGVIIPSDRTVDDFTEVEKTDEELREEADASFKLPNVENMSQSEADLKIEESKKAHRRTYKMTYITGYKARKRAYEAAVNKGGGKDGSSPHYWSFYAAYLMKIFIKTPENVQLGERNMKDRFIGFYPGAGASESSISLQTCGKLSAKVNAYKRFFCTWIGMTAEAEFELDSTSNNAGMIRYLANLQYSYNGMHGYGLFREVLIATKWKTGDALMKLWTQPTEAVIDQIADIFKNFESIKKGDGTTEKRTTYFKYARAVDPRFFLPLQPSQCLTFIYMCCKILNHFVSHTELSNPMKMVALQKMGKEQKEFLDIFVDVLLSGVVASTQKRTTAEIHAAEIYRMKKEQDEEAAEIKSSQKGVMALVRKKMLAKKGGASTSAEE
ncbi:TPA_asm: N [Dryobalanops betacytorhabdovirus 1]|nr:TPA_asm: N [Dryobalanops betacytorhabdovirus 1]